jgi:hypothetical protein
VILLNEAFKKEQDGALFQGDITGVHPSQAVNNSVRDQ